MNQLEKTIIGISIAILLSNASYSYSGNRIEWYLPIKVDDRQSLKDVRLTSIGRFGIVRKARPNIPAHLHTGIDIMRPSDNYDNEPIFPAAEGKVISLRDDGPYAQIIIEHTLEDSTLVWTAYEHVAGIKTKLRELVDPNSPIARFMNKKELNKYGWQFNHVHFEIMKVKPQPRQPDKRRPFLHYGTYCLVCYNRSDLQKRYYSPKEFFKSKWSRDIEKE